MVGKMTRKSKIVALSLAILAPVGLCVAQASFAAPNAGAGTLIDKDFEMALRKFVSKRFYNRIDATDEQRAKLDSIWMSTMEATRPQREQLRQGALELSNLIAGDEATDEQITQKVQQLRALHEKVMDQRIDSLLQARKVLTAEQRAQINERITQVITGGARPRRLGFMLNESL